MHRIFSIKVFTYNQRTNLDVFNPLRFIVSHYIGVYMQFGIFVHSICKKIVFFSLYVSDRSLKVAWSASPDSECLMISTFIKYKKSVARKKYTIEEG